MPSEGIAYYNERDSYAADWLENLIAAGHIAPGVVDRRSILDVRPSDVAGFVQCHFFAGLGGWSYALRLAGWPDDRSVWTGSCPCQPFSAAGKGGGFDDERHLWPAWHWLISQCRPPSIFGEQVAAKAVEPWVDLVQADLEALGYAFGGIAFPAASVGAPHIRDRFSFVANRAVADTGSTAERGHTGYSRGATGAGRGEARSPNGDSVLGTVPDDELADALCSGRTQGRTGAGERPFAGFGSARVVADSQQRGCQSGVIRPSTPEASFPAADGLTFRLADADADRRHADAEPGFRHTEYHAESCGSAGGLADADRIGSSSIAGNAGQVSSLPETECQSEHGASLLGRGGSPMRPGPTNGAWGNADWLFCRDGKWRPVESSPQPLVDGLPESLGRVRPETVAALEEEIVAYAKIAQLGPDEILREVCLSLAAQAQRGWEARRLPDLCAPAFLLSFVCQLATQGWEVTKGLPLSRPQDARPGMRMLWDDEAAARTSRQRRLEGQSAGECANALHLLSSVLARHAQAAWTDAYAAYAVIGFPLSRGETGRVGRLRAYGNAIVPQAQAEFIGAYLDGALP